MIIAKNYNRIWSPERFKWLLQRIITEYGLQKGLNALNDYCKEWKLNVNQKKTKCMIFSKASNTKNINSTINSKIIDLFGN